MRDKIEEYLRLKGYSGAALYEEASRVDRAVNGTIYSHEIYEYTCPRCQKKHWAKEGEPDICKEEIGVDSET